MGINHRSRVTRLYRLVWPLCAWSATLPEPFRRPPHAQKAAEESCRIRDLIPGKQAQFLRRLSNTLLRSHVEKRRRQHQTHDGPPPNQVARIKLLQVQRVKRP